MIEPENRMRPAPGEPWLGVPSSARTPERHRFAQPAVPEEIEEDDEDVEFLAMLARQAERETKVAPAPRPSTPRRFNVKADEGLEVFRETDVERPRPRVLNNMRIDAVEMDDLLEQLSTTAAALRRRKAA